MSFNKVDKTTGELTRIAGNGDVPIDSTPTQGSNHAVQSGGTFSAIKAVSDNVDKVSSQIETLTSALTNNVNVNGCKNLFLVDLEKIISTNKGGTWNGNIFTQKGATYTINDNDSVTFGGTPTDYTQIVFTQNVSKADKYMLSGLSGCTNVVFDGCSMYLNDTLVSSIVINSKQNTELDLSSYTFDRITIDVKRSANNIAMSGTAFIMLCLKSDWDLDQTYVPPTKTNRQLTKETTALLDNLEVNGAVNMLNPELESQVLYGITVTKNGDGSYTLDGSSGNLTGTIFFTVALKLKANHSYKGVAFISGGTITGSGSPTYTIDNRLGTQYYKAIKVNQTIVTPIFRIDADVTNYRCGIWIPTNATFSNVIVKPMVILASIMDYAFVPYAKTNKELTEDVTRLDRDAVKIVDSGIINANSSHSFTCTNYEGYRLSIYSIGANSIGMIVLFGKHPSVGNIRFSVFNCENRNPDAPQISVSGSTLTITTTTGNCYFVIERIKRA